MSRSTLESDIAAYSAAEYYDSYGKFFSMGTQRSNDGPSANLQ